MHRIHKKIGETPLEALKRFRGEHPEYKEARLSYAGRLDPMAEGELLILEGEENDRREEFLDRDKVYEFQILFGVSTDTFDLLGLVEDMEAEQYLSLTINEVQAVLDKFVGEWEMKYPPYSSKTVEVDGKKVPLWRLARADRLPGKLPTKEVKIYEADCESIEEIRGQKLLDYIHKHISQVSGDFRQEEILDCWRERFSRFTTHHSSSAQEAGPAAGAGFPLATCKVSCGSGTYVRRLAKSVGERLGVPALAFSIRRVNT